VVKDAYSFIGQLVQSLHQTYVAISKTILLLLSYDSHIFLQQQEGFLSQPYGIFPHHSLLMLTRNYEPRTMNVLPVTHHSSLVTHHCIHLPQSHLRHDLSCPFFQWLHRLTHNSARCLFGVSLHCYTQRRRGNQYVWGLPLDFDCSCKYCTHVEFSIDRNATWHASCTRYRRKDNKNPCLCTGGAGLSVWVSR
jgi:hypothetical protein